MSTTVELAAARHEVRQSFGGHESCDDCAVACGCEVAS